MQLSASQLERFPQGPPGLPALASPGDRDISLLELMQALEVSPVVGAYAPGP